MDGERDEELEWALALIEQELLQVDAPAGREQCLDLVALEVRVAEIPQSQDGADADDRDDCAALQRRGGQLSSLRLARLPGPDFGRSPKYSGQNSL